MTRGEIIEALKGYFDIKDLVCQHTWKNWGEKSWQFLSTEYLHTLLIVRRDILKSAMTCNNWSAGGSFSQRGLRCNICQIVIDKTKSFQSYLSAHVTGNGGDFDVKGMSAEAARLRIQSMSAPLLYQIRLEADVNWLHFDVYDSGSGEEVTVFKS